ncbi:MAG: SGNH/GDSL hydrolase family protein [bacterium]|nr:SGNH/GDSL hydrolase family protein [bacterium]
MRFIGLAGVCVLVGLAAAAGGEEGKDGGSMAAELTPYDALRGPVDNCRIQFTRAGEGRVAFLGGSITHMKGWRGLVCEMLSEQYPDTTFDFIDAGIPSTDSTMGAMRLGTDVFGRGQVDLLFVEYAVNDETNGRTEQEMVRGMEGVIRQARERNPFIDIVIMHFVEPAKMEVYNAGGVPPVIANHEKVAEHYAVASINLALEVTERIRAGEFAWSDFKDLHPAPFGHRLYRDSIRRLLSAGWAAPLTGDSERVPHAVPSANVDPLSYTRGRYVALDEAHLESGWKKADPWNPDDGASTRPGFVNVPMLVADTPGATLKLDFTGTAVGVTVAAGPDAGILECSIDGGPFTTTQQYTEWSHFLHIPWAHTLVADLEPGEHTMTLRMAEAKHPESKGHAARIVRFYAN